VNVAIALLGSIGGLVVGLGLASQARRDRQLDELLTADGRATLATVTAVVATGRHLSQRRVTVTVDGGGEFVQTFPFVEFGELGVVEGGRVDVRVIDDPATGSVRGRLVRPAGDAQRGIGTVPLAVGLFIAAVGLAAALVV
jgi:ABC-type phosphate transport system substrate-binding protein